MRVPATVVVLLAAVAGLTGCGTSSPPTGRPPDRVEPIRGSSLRRVILTPLGARRIGLQTTSVRHLRVGPHGSLVDVIPASAVVYDVHGRAYTYTRLESLQFVRRPIVITRTTGGRVYLGSHLRVGTRVVSVGGEELLGAELGVTSGE